MKKLLFSAALMGAFAASAVVPEVKYGNVTVPEGQTVSAEEAKSARSLLDSEGRVKPERARISMKKVNSETIAAMVAAFPEAPYVEARYSTIDDMSVFASMPNLKELDFYGSTVKDFAPLAACKKLEKVNYYAVKGPQEAFDSLGGLTQLKSLTGGLSEVKNLEFLRKLPQLEEFVVFAESVESLEPIGTLTKLKRVNIWNMDGRKIGARIVPAAGDLAYLANCTAIEKLELPGSDFTNLDALKGLVNVKEIRCVGARCDIDFSFAKGYDKVTALRAGGVNGKVTGLEAFAGKPLKSVDLDGAYDVDVSFVKECPTITGLDLNSGNVKITRKVKNFSALAGAPAISSLKLSGAEGIDFETIKSLPKLSFLVVSKDALTEAQIGELKAANPKIRVNIR